MTHPVHTLLLLALASGCAQQNPLDVDGDGLDDLLVGAYGNNDGASDAGKTYLILSGL